MKKELIFIMGSLYAAGVHAQLPKWVIPPTNDTIFVKLDNKILQTDTKGTTTLWSMDGKTLLTTDSRINPFNNGVATIVSKNSGDLEAVVDSDGKITSLPTGLKTAYGNPNFNNGYLLALEDGAYVYYRKDGSKADFPVTHKAYPFNNGYAPYLTYEQPGKRKNPYYGYHKAADGDPVYYKIMAKGEEKILEPKNIRFVSGINDKGQGVAIIKDKFYWFLPDTGLFEPFLWGDDENVKKQHLTYMEYEADEENSGDFLENLPSDSILIMAKYGKNSIASLYFDSELLPTAFLFSDGKELHFDRKAPEPAKYTSDLWTFANGLYGLALNSVKVLPPQFEQIGLKYGNRAFVRKEGKWGVLEIMPEKELSLKINKGVVVAFRHQKFDTQIRLDLPPGISAKDARIDIPSESGCILDKTSRESKDTDSGSFVMYNCSLEIPESLPDTITTITYSPVKISYEGLSLFDTTLEIKAWHLKYYNVDPIDSETSISNGVASFTIDINAQRIAGEPDYPFDVKIEADSVSVEYEKLSETRYKCLVSNLQEGNNNLSIIVTEKGCPPAMFPFEVFYTKPVPKSRKKEEVVIRKKAPAKRKSSFRLEI